MKISHRPWPILLIRSQLRRVRRVLQAEGSRRLRWRQRCRWTSEGDARRSQSVCYTTRTSSLGEKAQVRPSTLRRFKICGSASTSCRIQTPQARARVSDDETRRLATDTDNSRRHLASCDDNSRGIIGTVVSGYTPCLMPSRVTTSRDL